MPAAAAPTGAGYEPMAALTTPAQVAAKHQSLPHFVGNAAWSDAAMPAKVGVMVLPMRKARVLVGPGIPEHPRLRHAPEAAPSRFGRCQTIP
jgi:hypothetical protein